MRKYFMILIGCMLAALPAMGKQLTTNDKSLELRIVGTSDVHGCFFPYDFIERRAKAGTLARVASYVSRLRQQYDDRLLLLDNGDILQGQPVSYFSNYVDTTAMNIAASVINYMRYDAETVGNHDVEPGHAVYDKWARELRCPLLGANVVSTATGQPYLKPYTIIKRHGVRIAIIGLLTPAIPNWLQPSVWSGLRFDEMVTTARRWMKVVREEEKADVVIGLFHSGKDGGIVTPTYKEDAAEDVARQVPGFDLIIFGHDHTRHNDQVAGVDGRMVLCQDPANNAMTVTDATLHLAKRHGRWTVTSVTGQLQDVTGESVDSDFVQHFEPYINKVKAYTDEEIGTLATTMHSRDAFFGSSALSDLILNLQLKLTGADIAFNAPLLFNATLKAGPLRVADMFKLYRYENQLYVMRMTGAEIRRHLEMSYDLWVNTMHTADDHLLLLNADAQGDQQRLGFKNLTFNFDSAAGIDYEVDVTKPDGQKVRILHMSNGEPFDEARWYRVALNSYRANGGGELLTRGAGIPKDSLDSRIIYRSPRDQRHYLMEEIRRQGTIAPRPNGNWRFVPEAWTRPAAQRDSLLLFGR